MTGKGKEKAEFLQPTIATEAGGSTSAAGSIRTRVMEIPQDKVGCITASKVHLESFSKAWIEIINWVRSSPASNGAALVIIRGIQDEITDAEQMINYLLAQNGAGPSTNARSSDIQTHVMEIPKTLVGHIIGRGGQRINELRSSFGAWIKIIDHVPPPTIGHPISLVIIRATQRLIQVVEQRINDLLAQYESSTYHVQHPLSNHGHPDPAYHVSSSTLASLSAMHPTLGRAGSSSQPPLQAGLYGQYQGPNPPAPRLATPIPYPSHLYHTPHPGFNSMERPPFQPGAHLTSQYQQASTWGIMPAAPRPETYYAPRLATPTPYPSHPYHTPYPGFQSMEHLSVLRPPFQPGAHLTSQYQQASTWGIMPAAPRPETYYAPAAAPPLSDSSNPIQPQAVSIRQTRSHTSAQASETRDNH